MIRPNLAVPRGRGVAAGLLLILASLLASPAAAHRLRPAIVTVDFDGASADFSIQVVLNLEAVLVGIGPEHQDTSESPRAADYDALRLESPEILRAEFDAFAPEFLSGIDVRFDGQRADLELAGLEIPPVGDIAAERLTTVRLTGAIPTDARNFTWAYDPRFGESALRLSTPDKGIVSAQWLLPGQRSEEFPLDAELVVPRATHQVLADYAWLGFTHILPKGLDHILFVLGIFLLSLHWRPLLYQVTAFTVAHSITLALSLYGLVSLPASIVEPLIALSIVYVAVENVITEQLKPWRVYVVFGFGLLHGLGFAGVLTELGLPSNQYLTALIGFNVGVELGQLAVIALAFAAVGIWFRKRDWYHLRIVVPTSLGIAAIGLYWTVQRIFF